MNANHTIKFDRDRENSAMFHRIFETGDLTDECVSHIKRDLHGNFSVRLSLMLPTSGNVPYVFRLHFADDSLLCVLEMEATSKPRRLAFGEYLPTQTLILADLQEDSLTLWYFQKSEENYRELAGLLKPGVTELYYRSLESLGYTNSEDPFDCSSL